MNKIKLYTVTLMYRGDDSPQMEVFQDLTLKKAYDKATKFIQEVLPEVKYPNSLKLLNKKPEAPFEYYYKAFAEEEWVYDSAWIMTESTISTEHPTKATEINYDVYESDGKE